MKLAKADVKPIRQETQYTCMSASLCAALHAWGKNTTESEVNAVVGARPMQGASWEQILAAAQHFGCRATLTMPSTVGQLKEWTDAGVPVMIAWNPEGRDWSHASVVFDVDDDMNVFVMDPNMPDPDETVRVIPKSEFYGKWYEKWSDYLVRRPACAIEAEITKDGRQVMARAKRKNKPESYKTKMKVKPDTQKPRNPIQRAVNEGGGGQSGAGGHKDKALRGLGTKGKGKAQRTPKHKKDWGKETSLEDGRQMVTRAKNGAWQESPFVGRWQESKKHGVTYFSFVTPHGQYDYSPRENPISGKYPKGTGDLLYTPNTARKTITLANIGVDGTEDGFPDARRTAGRHDAKMKKARTASQPSYQDYRRKKKKEGKPPLSKENWEARALQKSKQKKKDKGVRPQVDEFITKKVKNPSAQVVKALKAAPQEVQQIMTDPEARKGILGSMRDKAKKSAKSLAKKVVSAARKELKELKHATHAAKKLMSKPRKKLTKDDKKALYAAGAYVGHAALTVVPPGGAIMAAGALGKAFALHVAFKAVSEFIDQGFVHYEWAANAFHAVGNVVAAEKDPTEEFLAQLTARIIDQLGSLSDEDMVKIMQGGSKPDTTPGASGDKKTAQRVEAAFWNKKKPLEQPAEPPLVKNMGSATMVNEAFIQAVAGKFGSALKSQGKGYTYKTREGDIMFLPTRPGWYQADWESGSGAGFAFHDLARAIGAKTKVPRYASTLAQRVASRYLNKGI